MSTHFLLKQIGVIWIAIRNICSCILKVYHMNIEKEGLCASQMYI